MNLIRVPKHQISRRRFLNTFLNISGFSGISLLLSSCGIPIFEGTVGKLSEPLNQKIEALLQKSQTPVPEFSIADIQPDALIVISFRFNPVINLEKYRLNVDGEVSNPLNLNLSEIHALPTKSMIIRHVCVEGWAAIVQWAGVGLRDIIALAQPSADVKYVYLQSADGYYSSWDIASALHPQTLLAYEKNGEPLPVENGAPLRLASPIKLGYKQSKWVMKVTLTSELSRNKGYWEDQGYEWFAGL